MLILFVQLLMFLNKIAQTMVNYASYLIQKTCIVFNKIDLVKIKKFIKFSTKANNKGFNNIYDITITIKCQIFQLISKLPSGIWHYNEDDITDRSVKQLAEDVTIEQLYKLLNKEIPYNLKVETESWKEEEEVIIIHQIITVLKASQKKIILGTKGENIKKISIRSKAGIEKLTNKKIHLYLFIKVRENWMDKL